MLCDWKYSGTDWVDQSTDLDISLDKLRSEGWRRWNTDMDTEYQYETFNGLSVYYGGDKCDSDDSDEFYPDTPENMEDGVRNQSRPGGGDNNCMIEVDVTPRCNTASERLESEVLNHNMRRTVIRQERGCQHPGHVIVQATLKSYDYIGET